MKPHRGRIKDWVKIPGVVGGDVIIGTFLDHPWLGKSGGPSMTSKVIHHDTATGEIETENSRYTLLAPDPAPRRIIQQGGDDAGGRPA